MSDYLQAKHVAKKFDITTATLARWRYEGKGPKGWFYAAPNVVVYPVKDVEEFEREWSKGVEGARPDNEKGRAAAAAVVARRRASRGAA